MSAFYGLGLFFSMVVMANKAKQITNQIPGHPDSGMATAAVVGHCCHRWAFHGYLFLFFLQFRPKYEVKYPRQSTAVTCWPEVLDGGGPEVDVSN